MSSGRIGQWGTLGGGILGGEAEAGLCRAARKELNGGFSWWQTLSNAQNRRSPIFKKKGKYGLFLRGFFTQNHIAKKGLKKIGVITQISNFNN